MTIHPGSERFSTQAFSGAEMRHPNCRRAWWIGLWRDPDARRILMLSRKSATMKEQSVDARFARLYEELKRLARRKRMPAEQTLDTTGIVHELYLSMVDGGALKFEHPRQFYAYAARAIRHLLIDRARSRERLRHGGDLQRVDWDCIGEHERASDPRRLLELDRALDDLTACDGRAAEVFELHYFAGQDLSQTADLLGISRRTADRDWQFARAYLQMQLE
ncbi:MAG TPA: ECF-type sigma factor [Xanthomonadales bacterium]|nr:ECF-type sigma factor [Xanthomonadales bacterium]